MDIIIKFITIYLNISDKTNFKVFKLVLYAAGFYFKIIFTLFTRRRQIKIQPLTCCIAAPPTFSRSFFNFESHSRLLIHPN